MSRAFVILLIAGDALGCGGECQSVCFDSVAVDAVVELPVTSLANTTIVFCRDHACSEPTPLDNDGTIDSGGLCAEVNLADEVTVTTVTVVLDLASRNCAFPTLRDGDEYSIAITDTNGMSITEQSGVASYHDVSSCGTECQNAFLHLTPK